MPLVAAPPPGRRPPRDWFPPPEPPPPWWAWAVLAVAVALTFGYGALNAAWLLASLGAPH